MIKRLESKLLSTAIFNRNYQDRSNLLKPIGATKLAEKSPRCLSSFRLMEHDHTDLKNIIEA